MLMDVYCVKGAEEEEERKQEEGRRSSLHNKRSRALA